MSLKSSREIYLTSGLGRRIFKEEDVIYLSTSNGTRFGLVPRKTIPLLECFPRVFIVSKDKNSVQLRGDDFAARTAFALVFSSELKENFDELSKKCNLEKLKIGWRNEEFGVYPIGKDPRCPESALFTIERALCKVLGIESYGVHCNVFREDEQGQKNLWVGQRALDKSTFPGKLDTAIGGGMIYGLTVEENLVKVKNPQKWNIENLKK